MAKLINITNHLHTGGRGARAARDGVMVTTAEVRQDNGDTTFVSEAGENAGSLAMLWSLECAGVDAREYRGRHARLDMLADDLKVASQAGA
jgi:hypothetical protein